MVKRWIPLEANPQVLDEYAASLGVCDVFSEYMTHDVLGLDPDLLSMVPQPALAVILLYPLTEASEAKRKEGVICSQRRCCILCFHEKFPVAMNIYRMYVDLLSCRVGKSSRDWWSQPQLVLHEADHWQCLWDYCLVACHW